MAEYTDIDFLRESSYLFPDFEDIIDNVDKNKREISPLDYLPLIDSKDNQEILDIILSDIPFYHVSPQKVLFDDDANDINNLSESRDSGVVNVPSIMQTNDFYQTWFREAWGYLYNKLILDVYNKLRYPFISEHQYLMINTISNIIDTIFKSGNDYEKINLSTDYSSLNEVIKAKINSTISLLGITFNSNEFLDTIIESMYYGGVLSSSERDTEKYVYLLQEVRNELLKRKLAGTFSMYKIAISSLGRNGSFVNACKIKDVLDRHDNSSNGERYYRYVNILGLTTKKETSSDYTFDVESIYDDIPQKLVSEIFFSSKENEYFTSNNKNSYLRDSVSVVNWNALEGIVSQENIIDNYDYLDKLVDIESEEIIALDKKSLEDVNKTKIYRYLDHKSPSTMYESLLRANILDISADRLLYHDYTKTSGIDKSQYLTYSIANGNGISLIDSFWLNYLENSLKDKTKVIDNTLYGVQVSKYVDLTNPIVEKNFFGYEKKDSKVYLYYCSVKYSIEDFLITEISKRLITVIATRKKVDKEKLYNEGIIPFTYKDYVDENIELLEEESETLKYKGYNKCYFAFSESDITKNLLPNGDPSDLDSADSIIHNYSSDNESIRTIYYIVPRESDEVTTDGKVKIDYFWSEPINVIDLGEEESSWFSIANLKNKHFSPDWKGLAFYLNPYLNFTKESASPLRHKNVFTTDILEAKRNIDTAKNSTGASENTILCNLTRMRELDYWANDNDSEDKSIWSDVLAKEGFSTYIGEKLGLYLNKSTSGDLTSNENTTNAKIFGDNRTLDDLDIRDRSLSNKENLTASNNTDSIETLIKNEGITPDKCILYIVQYPNNLIRYFTYNDEKTSYTEIVKDDIMKLSTIYSDFSYKDYCISIQKDDNPKSSSQFDIFNHLEIVSTTKEDSGKECYWDTSLYNDQTEWGRTLCMNIHLSEDNNLADEEEYTLLQQKENDKNKNFSLVILKNADDYKVKFYWYPIRSTDLSWFITSNSIDISQNLRISASAYFVDDSNTGNINYDNNKYLKIYLSLVVNGKLTERSFRLKNILGAGDYYDIDTESQLSTTDRINFCIGNTIITSNEQKYYDNPDELLPIKQAPIYIGYDGTNTTFMDIFDLRLYNEGKSPEELRLLNMGTMYELYSYSPCAYNLAHNLYNDMGIFKIYNTQDKVNEKSLNTIRLFNRDVWDSILVDNFPITESEKSKGPQYKINWEDPKNDIDIYHKVDNTNFALNDCIEQELLDEREVYNNRALSEDIKLIYKGESIDIKKDNLLDIVLSTISPSVGNAVALSNSQSLYYYNNVFSSKAISIPVDTSSANNYFSYKADLYPTFKLDNNISLDSWLTRGNNITVTYDESNNCNLVTLADTSIKDSERNSAVYPLYVSDGEEVKFKIKDYKLSNTLCQLLKATSYYTEVCIPVPCKTKDSSYTRVTTDSDSNYKINTEIPAYYIYNTDTQTYTQATGVFSGGVDYYTRSYVKVDSSNVNADNVNDYFIQDGKYYSVAEKVDKENIKSYYTLSYPHAIKYEPTGKYYILSEGKYSIDSTVTSDNFSNYYVENYELATEYSADNTYYTLNDTSYTEVDLTEDKFDATSYYIKNGYVKATKYIEGTPYYTYDGTSYSKATDVTADNFSNYYVENYESATEYSADNTYYTVAYTYIEASSYNKDTSFYKEDYSKVVVSEDVIPAYYILNTNNKYTFATGVFFENEDYYSQGTIYNPTYHYKWDGIRLLKSGDYKVTCKYPMRIRHFNPSNTDDSSTTTFYGTLSFNINVVITPKDNSNVASNFTANILPSRKEYYKDNLGNHITYVDPQKDDNVTTNLTYHFPHADVVITVTCNDKQITPTADGFVDIDTPLLLNKFYKSSNTKEDFTINTGDIEDLNSKDSITLNKDTAYELFIDYDGCVTELSFDGYNILENVNTTDYSNFMYTKDVSDNLNIDSTKNSGFEVENTDTLSNVSLSDSPLTFGDYKEITSSKNALYSLLVDSSYSKQWDVDNSYPIYYLDTLSDIKYNVSSTIYSETTFVSPAVLDEIVAFTDSAGVFEKTDLIEKDILKDIYDELSIGNSLLKISRNSSMGLLSGLSGLMVESGKNKSIELEDYNLYAYKKPALEFKNKGNSSEQSYTSLDSNNLFGRDVYSFIKDEWTVYDTYSQAIKAEDIIIHDNKRVLSISGYTSGTITLTSKENVFNTYGTFEVSLKATGVSTVKVKITNYKSSTFNNAHVDITLSKTNTDDTYSGSSTKSIQANMVNVELTPNTDTETITISDFVIKKKGSQVNDSTNGIYNAYSSSTYSNIYLSSYEIAVLEDKNNTGKYIPIQFKSSIRQGNDGYLRPNYGSTQSMLFISNNSYQDYPENSSIKELVNPWRKQVNIVNDSGSLIYHIYSYTKNARGLDAIKQMDDKSILWFDNDGVELQSQSNGYSIHIKSLHCDFTKYNSNLTLFRVDLLNDSISYLYNCFNINNYLNSDKSNVVVTNIQFLSKDSTNTNDKTILYELEYLPIIYDEKKHHLSVNLMLKKN